MLPFSKKTAILIAIISAVMACIGDILLLYHPDGDYENADYRFFEAISLHRILVGHYLGLVFIPLYVFGFYVLYDLFAEKSPRFSKMLFWFSSLLLFPGVAYHTYCSALAVSIQEQTSPYQNEKIELLKLFSDPMAAIFIGGFCVFSMALGWGIYNGKSKLSKSLAFYNPLIVYLICVIAYFYLPFIGSYLIVAGFNFSILILFMAVAFHSWNRA